MKKKFSFPAFAGISAVLLVLVLFRSPLFDYTAEARLWADYETAWPLFVIPPVTFWIVGAAAYICAAGKGYFMEYFLCTAHHEVLCLLRFLFICKPP